MSRKLNVTSKSKSTTPSGVIVNMAVKDIKSDSNKQAQTQSTLNGADRHEMIATAAYYRAKRRGFNNGDEIEDWLEAEAEVDGLI